MVRFCGWAGKSLSVFGEAELFKPSPDLIHGTCMDEKAIVSFCRNVIRKARKQAVLLNGGTGLMISALVLALLFWINKIFQLALPWPFFLLSLVPIAALIAWWPQRIPKPAYAIAAADRYLGLQERLVTANEVLGSGQASNILEQRLVSDTAQAIQGFSPRRALPSPSIRLPAILLSAALVLFLVLPYLPSIPPARNAVLPQIDSLLQQIEELESPQTQTIRWKLLQAKRLLEQNRQMEAGQALEEAQALTRQGLTADEQAQRMLAEATSLEFLAQGLDGNQDLLQQLSSLTPAEQTRLATMLQNEMSKLPEGAVKTGLERLGKALRQEPGQVSSQAKSLSEVMPLEKTLLRDLGQAVADWRSGESTAANAEAAAAAAPAGTEVQPASGLGTQGGINRGQTQQQEGQAEYVQTPANGQETAASGFVYVPRDFAMSQTGQPLVLPRTGEGQMQLKSEGESTFQGSFTNYRDVLPAYERSASDQMVRQAFPPQLEDLVARYFQSLEQTP
jgi:hypothetical protein